MAQAVGMEVCGDRVYKGIKKTVATKWAQVHADSCEEAGRGIKYFVALKEANRVRLWQRRRQKGQTVCGDIGIVPAVLQLQGSASRIVYVHQWLKRARKHCRHAWRDCTEAKLAFWVSR